MAQNGCVLFAKNVESMTAFYQSVLNMDITEAGKSHTVLSNGSIELVIHGIPAKVAESIVINAPPEQRNNAVFKPAFVVPSLDDVQRTAKAGGGGLKPKSAAWEIRGALVLDGWDPEGNIIQFKQFGV